MNEDRLQRIEELLHDLNIKFERSMAAGEARVSNCHERFDRGDRKMDRLTAEIDGNGKRGLKAEVQEIRASVTAIADNIEKRRSLNSKWFWLAIAGLQTLTTGAALAVFKFFLERIGS